MEAENNNTERKKCNEENQHNTAQNSLFEKTNRTDKFMARHGEKERKRWRNYHYLIRERRHYRYEKNEWIVGTTILKIYIK